MDLMIKQLWSKLIQDSFDEERNMTSLHRKQTGSYYTGLDLAYEMMKELVFEFKDKTDLVNKKVLEPCAGTGNFIFAYLRVCYEIGFSKDEFNQILNNIYVCDINRNALEVYKRNLIDFSNKIFGIELDENYFSTHIGGGLLVDVEAEIVEYISLDKIFPSNIVKGGFDIVVTNPPYKNLKAESSHYISDEEKNKDKEKYKRIVEIGKTMFPFSSYGTLNLYKMFVEEIVEKYCNDNGYCSLLIPSSILSDKNCSHLRTHLIKEYSLKSLYLIPENSCYVDASQALCAMLISKSGTTSKIKIRGRLSDEQEFNGTASIEDIIDENTGNSILVLSPADLAKKKKMEQNPKIKSLSYIKNLRGELDITFHKNFITKQVSPLNFYRGRSIGFYKTIKLEEQEYVNPEFLQICTKSRFINMKRLACQQIANMSKKKRIAYTIINENCVLGNSCNFIAIDNDEIDIYFLLGVLNSRLIEWYFNLTSSNNHVNNYEIDNFPIPIYCSNKNKISELVKQFVEEEDESILEEIEKEVKTAYGIQEVI